MRLEILYERLPVAYHPASIPSSPVAEFINNLAFSFGKRGWTVIVYVHDTCQQPYQKDNVIFLDRLLYDNENSKTHRDRVLCLNCQPSTFESQAKYYLLVDPFIPTASVQFDESKFENLILLSEEQTKNITNVPKRKIKLIERVPDESVIGNVALKDKANIVLYTGPHDSNLIKILGLWWKVNKNTDYELIVAGTSSAMCAIDGTGVTYYQTPSNSEMTQFFRQAKFWLNYEANTIVAKININKAISANAIPLYEKGALHSNLISDIGLSIDGNLEKNLIEILNGHKVLYRHFEKSKAENYNNQFELMIDAYEDMFSAKLKTKNIST